MTMAGSTPKRDNNQDQSILKATNENVRQGHHSKGKLLICQATTYLRNQVDRPLMMQIARS